MLLAVDVGNTQTVFGLFEGAELVNDWRISTERTRTGDELGAMLRSFLDLESLDGACLSSTVPQLVREYERFAERTGLELLTLGPGTRTGMPIRYDDPRQVGPDRIANAVAAQELHGAPCIVVDFGTSTNFDVVGARGEFMGGALAPGIEISLDALAARAAQLRTVELIAPRSPIGKSTVEALQSGILYGFAGQVDGMVRRLRKVLEPNDPESVEVIATGGLAPLMIPHSEALTRHEPDLTLIGLRLIYERNT